MNLIAQALIEGGTGKIECPVLAAIARRAECSAGTLYMIARGHKTASAKLSLRIEQATGGKVTRHDLRPDVFGPAEDASQGPATEQPSARAVFGQHQPGIAPAPVPVASSGVSKRALRQRLGFAADAPWPSCCACRWSRLPPGRMTSPCRRCRRCCSCWAAAKSQPAPARALTRMPAASLPLRVPDMRALPGILTSTEVSAAEDRPPRALPSMHP